MDCILHRKTAAIAFPPRQQNLITFPGYYHGLCKDGTPIRRVLQTRGIVPSPRVVVDDLFKGWRLDEFLPVPITGELHNLEYIQIAYPAKQYKGNNCSFKKVYSS